MHPRPFLHHMGNQTPWGSSAGARALLACMRSYSPSQISPCLSCRSMGLSPPLLYSPCSTWSLPAPHSWKVGALTSQNFSAHHSPPWKRLGTAIPAATSLRGHRPAHCFGRKYLSRSKMPFFSPHGLTPSPGTPSPTQQRTASSEP